MIISFWLHQEAQHDLNICSAYLHMLGDALSLLVVTHAMDFARKVARTSGRNDPCADVQCRTSGFLLPSLLPFE
jgi:Co/Zn/Cd efflux system component